MLPSPGKVFKEVPVPSNKAKSSKVTSVVRVSMAPIITSAAAVARLIVPESTLLGFQKTVAPAVSA
jgi:hypothetical protein